MADLIAAIATARPDEPALVDEHGSTSWAEFDARTNRLIAALRKAISAPEFPFLGLGGYFFRLRS